MAEQTHAAPQSHNPRLAHHFDTPAQQYESASLGMWAFLATEAMLFSAFFLAYAVYRFTYPEAFAEASRHLAVPAGSPWYLQSVFLGTVNTTVLLCSSFSMAVAVHAAQTGRRGRIVAMLLLTMLLGAIFLGIKGLEYYLKFIEGLVPGPRFFFEGAYANQAELFFLLYFVGTGLHALHMLIGLGLLAAIAFLAWRRHYSADYFTPVELTGLYWHFVDVVWVFLFPLFYLIGLHT